MPSASIQFFYEDIDFKLKNSRKITPWLKNAIKQEGKIAGDLNFIFCSDEHLIKINREYLHHDTYTDIITFDTSEEQNRISGDIFISFDRVKENAAKFQTKIEDELHRVIMHGILHLVGYSDKTSKNKIIMREKEDAYLSLR